METKKTHWRELHETDYIGAYSLDNGKDGYNELPVTILSVKKETVTGEGGRKEECTVAQIKDQKPFILNVTNCKMITKIADSPYIEDWAGINIVIGVDKVNFRGDWVEGLRIRDKSGASKLKLTPKSEGWDKAKQAILTGQYTIDQIKKKYSLTPENEKLLCEVTV